MTEITLTMKVHEWIGTVVILWGIAWGAAWLWERAADVEITDAA
mgnify:CR=1 FL=1